MTEATTANTVDFLGATPGQAILIDFGDSITTDGGTGLKGMTQYATDSAVSFQWQDGHGATPQPISPNWSMGPGAALWSAGAGELWVVGPDNGSGELLAAMGWHFVNSVLQPRWVQVPEIADCRGLWGSGADNIVAVCDGGRIMRYDGKTWTQEVAPAGPQMTLNAVWGSGPSNIFAVGRTTILRYDGKGWSTLVSSPDLALNAVWGAGPTHIIVGGDQGKVLRLML
jgi:hypothetical protein